ncbi:MAG: hypothetical protein GX936_00155 [Clostridiales bacterium]|nr:hypothetical protein [Clostridiales bacterium]
MARRFKMKSRSMISLILLLTLFLTTVMAAGCKKVPDPSSGDTTAADTEENIDPAVDYLTVEGRKKVSDGLGSYNFGGVIFNVIEQHKDMFAVNSLEEANNVISVGKMRRNAEIESRFGVKFNIISSMPYKQIVATVAASVLSDSDEYQLVLNQLSETVSTIVNDYCLNWYDIPHMDFDKPWYPKNMIENATLNNKMYILISDLIINATDSIYVIYFDKDVATSRNIPDLYKTVKDGKWTVDLFEGYIKDTYQDLNNNGQIDFDGDFFGLATTDNFSGFYYGMGQNFFRMAENNSVEYTFNSESSFSVIDRIKELNVGNRDVVPYDANNRPYNLFLKQRALFAVEYLVRSYTDFTQRDGNYGILPFPKLNEEQTNYYSTGNLGMDCMTVPRSVQNTEMVGVLVTALSAYNWKNIMLSYYNEILDYRGARDQESVEMLDIIKSNLVVDFGFLYNGPTGWLRQINFAVMSDQGVASYYERVRNTVEDYYQKLEQYFNS